MTSAPVLKAPASRVAARVAAQDHFTLAHGAAHSEHTRTAMTLRIVSGQAWATLAAGPYGMREASGDVFLVPGQSLRVAAGQHLVLEALGPSGLQYQWCATVAAVSFAGAAAPGGSTLRPGGATHSPCSA